jgi:hypothetical protein
MRMDARTDRAAFIRRQAKTVRRISAKVDVPTLRVA